MRLRGEYAGIVLVAAALLLGGGLAVAAYEISGSAKSQGGVPASTPTAEGSVQRELALGDRTVGRTIFRAECQECHTQGRQSIKPEARERVRLLEGRIREGLGEMPPFPRERISDGALRDLLAYIATPSEAEPTPTAERRVAGVNFAILDAVVRPGEPAEVQFRIRDDNGIPIPPAQMAALALTVGGPTVDYQWATREDARRAQSLPDGSARYVFSQRLPTDAEGTFAIGIEGYFQHPAGVAGPQPVRDTGYNVVAYFSVTDTAPVARRIVVRTESCNQCHGTLALHGGTRRNTEYCVMCHNATGNDGEKRQVAGGPMPPESILFAYLIHRIHTGEDLTNPFVIYGGAPAAPQPIDLSTVHPFPADRANCALCHEPRTYAIVSALERSSPMRVDLDGLLVREVPRVTAACIGCHTGQRTLAHVASQTTPAGVESCATCHGPGRPFSVETVHRIVVPDTGPR